MVYAQQLEAPYTHVKNEKKRRKENNQRISYKNDGHMCADEYARYVIYRRHGDAIGHTS